MARINPNHYKISGKCEKCGKYIEDWLGYWATKDGSLLCKIRGSHTADPNSVVWTKRKQNNG